MTRILLVDDSEAVRQTIRAMLANAGHEVTEVKDGGEAVRVFRTEQFDLVLCDMFMPMRDGVEAIRELRRKFPGVKIIAMSGGGFDGKIDMLPVARALGAAQILHKPFSRDALLAAVEDVVQTQVTV
jgi:CheY-like chemotaxis protein